jgi:hypothetical protein
LCTKRWSYGEAVSDICRSHSKDASKLDFIRDTTSSTSELDRLVEAGELKKEDVELPDLGPLPPASPELLPAKPDQDDELSASEPEEFDESASEASEGSDDDEDEELDKKKRRTSGSGS